jgi:hypothetical protein
VSARTREAIQRELDSWSECTCDQGLAGDANCPYRFPEEREKNTAQLEAELARSDSEPAPLSNLNPPPSSSGDT